MKITKQYSQSDENVCQKTSALLFLSDLEDKGNKIFSSDLQSLHLCILRSMLSVSESLEWTEDLKF